MADERLRVIARLEAQPDKVDVLRSLLTSLLVPTRDEPGCVRYELLQNKETAREFTFVEEWQSDQALQDHFGTSHIQRALADLPDLLAAPMDLRRYRLVG